MLMVGHRSVLFPIDSPKRKAYPHLSMSLLFPITDHRGSGVSRQIALGISLSSSARWGGEIPPFTNEKRIQWVQHARLISLLPSPFPSLSISTFRYGVSSFYFLLLLIPFLSSSSFFGLADTRGQCNLTYLSVLFFHQRLHELLQQREELERTYKNQEVCGKYFEIWNKLVQQNSSL